MTMSANDNSPDERLALAIRSSIETLDAATEIDADEMAHWLQAKFPNHSQDELTAAVRRHCEAFGRPYR
jgi:hypothetical protein